MTLVQVERSGFLGLDATEPSSDALIVRPSSHASFALCGYRVLYSKEEGFDNTSSEAMSWGTGVHKVINNHIVASDIAGLTDTVDGVLLVWAQEMADREDKEDIFSYASHSFLRGKAQEMLDAYHLWVERFWLPIGQHLEIVAVEATNLRPLGILPSGREAWVRGTADFITEGKVWDWKSSGRGWKKGKAEASATQLLAYAWLAEAQTNVTEGTFVVYDRSKRSWSWDETTFRVTEPLIRQALLSLWDLARAIDSGVAVATPMTTGGFGDGRGWHCSPKFCGAWSICSFRHMIPDGKGDLVRGPQKWD